MAKHATTRRGVAIAAIAALTMTVGGPVAAAEDSPFVEIAGGFSGPLGLAIGQDGTAYVAEAFSGQLTSFSLRQPTRRQVLTQQPGFLPGVDAVGKGNVYYTASTETDTTLNRVGPNGRSTVVASLGTYEATVNPDQDQVYGFLPGSITEDCRAQLADPVPIDPYTGYVDSNPYAVAIDGGSVLVADAAGNSIIRVTADGRMSTVAVLPPVDQVVTQETADEFGLPDCVVGSFYTGEFVPTDVEVGPDGYLYVSSLPGVPEGPGEGSVWRVNPRTGAATMVADGFFGAVDLAVARDGTIYVAELFANRISVLSSSGDVLAAHFALLPGAIEVARDGSVYATLGTFIPGGGSVVRLR